MIDFNREEMCVVDDGYWAQIAIAPGHIRFIDRKEEPCYRSLWHWFKCWMGWDKPVYYLITMQFVYIPEDQNENLEQSQSQYS